MGRSPRCCPGCPGIRAQASRQLCGGELTLGNVFRKKKQCEQAIPHYEAAIRLQPDDPFAHGNIGFCYAKSNKDADAIRMLLRDGAGPQ